MPTEAPRTAAGRELLIRIQAFVYDSRVSDKAASVREYARTISAIEAHAVADLLDVGDIPHLFRLRIDYSPGMKEKFEQPDWHAVIERWPAGEEIERSDSYGDTLPELVAAIAESA